MTPAAAAADNGALVTVLTPHGIESFETDRVINCTGPSMNYRRVHSPLLQRLFSQGLISPGPLGGGLNSTRAGAVIDAKGKVNDLLFHLGPSRLGTLIESIAVPEIRQQAVELVHLLAERQQQEQAPEQITEPAPEQNARPLPRTTTTHTSGSPAAASA